MEINMEGGVKLNHLIPPPTPTRDYGVMDQASILVRLG